MPHHDVRVQPVADHGDLIAPHRFLAEHRVDDFPVRLADHFRRHAGRGGDQGGHRAAVRDVAGLGRTVEVRMRRNERHAAPDKIAGPDQLVVGQRHVEAEHHIVGVFVRQHEPMALELGFQIRRSEKIDPGRRFQAAQIKGRGFAGSQNLAGLGRPAELGQFLRIILGVPRRIVSQKQMVPAGLAEVP